MVVFSDIFSTQSFIMSGVSLTEQDADYYLSFRTSVTQRAGSYPSILIEPNPDPYTIDVCKKRGLQLICGTFDEFMKFLEQELPCVPTAYDLTRPKIDYLVEKGISEKEKFLFFSEFEQVTHDEGQKTNEMSLFDWGFEPNLSDIFLKRDILRDKNSIVLNAMLKSSSEKHGRIVILSGKYLNGKTTIAFRVMDTLAGQGNKVFRMKALKGFTLSNTIKCISSFTEKVFLYIDNLAEYIEPVGKLLLECQNVVILGTEREYRMDHVQKVLAGNIEHYNCDKLSVAEKERLLAKYTDLGHVLNKNALNGNINFSNHTIGEAVCLILDSYDPIAKKIPEIMDLYGETDRKALVAVAICCYCYKIGVNYFLIRGILPNTYDFNRLFKTDTPFRLEFNHEDNNYVLPRNRLYFQSLVDYYLKEDIEILQRVYIEIVKKIAPYVNRQTIIAKAPETKLMGRMLDADKNVKHFLGAKCDTFFDSIQPVCAWNSRYWEQRALSLVHTNISLSLDYARHAVSIESHPYTLATLGHILFVKMTKSSGYEETTLCAEALQVCYNAMREEEKRKMTTIHPLKNILIGLGQYMQKYLQETIPRDLRRNVYAAINHYRQAISLTPSEENEAQMAMDYLF